MKLLKKKIRLGNVHTFFHQKFPKKDALPFDPYNADEENQALKLVLVTAVVHLVLYLDL